MLFLTESSDLQLPKFGGTKLLITILFHSLQFFIVLGAFQGFISDIFNNRILLVFANFKD